MTDIPSLFGSVRVVIHDLATGVIQYVSHVPAEVAHLQAGAGQGFLISSAGDAGALWYVNNGQIVPRPFVAFDRASIVAGSETPARVDLPGRTFEVRVDDRAYGPFQNFFEFTSDMPGDYKIEINCDPYLPFKTVMRVV